MNNLTRKNVFISGSSRGIGKAIALKFAKEGYGVAINCINNNELLKSVESEILAYNVPCIALIGDISNYSITQSLFEKAYTSLGDIDVLINNAGISNIGLFTDLSPGDWNQVISTNLNSVFNCCHNIIPKMIQAKKGTIINITSVWGEVGASCEVAYSASKGAVNSFTKALAKELAPSNIHVNAISCGAIETDMNNFLSLEEKQTLIDDIPTNRFGTPDEVANIAHFLASDNSNYINGQIIRVDGGWI